MFGVYAVLRSGIVALFLWAMVLPGVSSAQETETGYQLSAGDRVRVVVFGEDELSGEFELDGQGDFSMPLIGTIKANFTTSRQLEERIAVLMRDGFLKNPRVSVEVLNYRPFYILGEVNNPGSYPYRAGITILNAAAIAGGFTYRADEKDIEVSRGGAGEGVRMPADTIVQPGDVIRVKESFF
jgi:polysaccharide export outer membrane protein